jgi:hypothetical protein
MSVVITKAGEDLNENKNNSNFFLLREFKIENLTVDFGFEVKYALMSDSKLVISNF